MFNPKAVQSIDPATIEQYKSQYPWIQWVNGDGRQQRNGGFAWSGGFFIPEKSLQAVDSLPFRDILVAAKWLPETVYFGKEQTATSGWSATSIDFIPIAKRRRWKAIIGADTTYLPYSWTVWEDARRSGQYDRMSSQLQVLGLLRGAEQLGKIVLTLSGSFAMAFDGTAKQPGVMQRFKDAILGEAYRRTKQPWPERLFYIRFGCDMLDGKPVFQTVGKGSSTSKVTLPTWIPISIDDAAVPDSLIPVVEDVYSSSDEWVAEWANLQSPAVAAAPAAAPAPAANRPPTAVEYAVSKQWASMADEDVPF